MISSMTVWPIIAALWGAADYLGVDNKALQPHNQEQTVFVDRYMQSRDALNSFAPHELRTWASSDIPYLNRILADEGFTIQLTPTPLGLGIVSIMDIAVQWPQACKNTEFFTNDILYTAFEAPFGNFILCGSATHEHVLIALTTQHDDVVWITVADKPYSHIELIDRICHIRAHRYRLRCPYEHVVIPNVIYEESAQLDWLKGLGCGDYTISQAIQQTKFKLNAIGAHAQSAVAMMAESAFTPPSKKLIIDKPFFVWIERPGVQEPVFVGYMDEQYWCPSTLYNQL